MEGHDVGALRRGCVSPESRYYNIVVVKRGRRSPPMRCASLKSMGCSKRSCGAPRGLRSPGAVSRMREQAGLGLATVSARIRILVRRAVRSYVHHFPLDRGKGRVIQLVEAVDSDGDFRAEVGSGIWMSLDMARHVDRLVYYYGFYRPWVREHFVRLLRHGYNVVDVGASIGCFSLVAGQFVGASGRVVAFEPHSASFSRLERNLALNRHLAVEAHELVVADVEGRLPLHVNRPAHSNQSQSAFSAPWHAQLYGYP